MIKTTFLLTALCISLSDVAVAQEDNRVCTTEATGIEAERNEAISKAKVRRYVKEEFDGVKGDIHYVTTDTATMMNPETCTYIVEGYLGGYIEGRDYLLHSYRAMVSRNRDVSFMLNTPSQ